MRSSCLPWQRLLVELKDTPNNQNRRSLPYNREILELTLQTVLAHTIRWSQKLTCTRLAADSETDLDRIRFF
jgi:hypothetical protein